MNFTVAGDAILDADAVGFGFCFFAGHRLISFAVILKLHDVYNFVNRLDKNFRPCYVLCIARVRLDGLRAAQVG